MKIRIIVTGGTFDKHYDEIRGNLTFKDTHLPEILKFVRCAVPIELETNQLIDSLDMRIANRLQVLESCRRAPESHIVITHGTDTMVETARVRGEAKLGEGRRGEGRRGEGRRGEGTRGESRSGEGSGGKTIVLTGAMVPFIFSNSDAVFNLGCAITAVQIKPPGVYIAMNGMVFPWDNVRKNREIGSFEELGAS